MKHIIALFVIGGLLCGPAVIWAGDKEELAWKVQAFQEKAARLQMEFQVNSQNLKEAQEALKKIIEAEKAKPQEKPGSNPAEKK